MKSELKEAAITALQLDQKMEKIHKEMKMIKESENAKPEESIKDVLFKYDFLTVGRGEVSS